MAFVTKTVNPTYDPYAYHATPRVSSTQVVQDGIEVEVRKGRPIEVALRIFKRRTRGIVREVKERKYYVPPSKQRREDEKRMDLQYKLREAHQQLDDGMISEEDFEARGLRHPGRPSKKKQKTYFDHRGGY